MTSTKDEIWDLISKFEVTINLSQERTMEFKDVIRGEPVERKRRSRRNAG